MYNVTLPRFAQKMIANVPFRISKLQSWEIEISWLSMLKRTSEQSLIEALAEMPDSDSFLVKVQEKILAKKQEQYEALKPAGFEHAPQSAKKKRQELIYSNDVEKMKWCYDNVSYNADGTMNIIKLKKTFCEDISGKNQLFNVAQSQNIEKTNVWWYRLMTDYNDWDLDEVKKKSDWYQVINIFSHGNWDIVDAMIFFKEMAWCNNRYWTATRYKNELWEGTPESIRVRMLDANYICRSNYSTLNSRRVCGLKDSI